MKEKLHTIPVNEAFDNDGECPLCSMHQSLEEKAIDFTMGPSYMEDDVREATSRFGFCGKHLAMMYNSQNRLGMSLIIKSHMDKIIRDVEKLTGNSGKAVSLFRKKGGNNEVSAYLSRIVNSCYICDKIDGTMDRYIATLFHLYRTDESFRQKFEHCKGFCTEHYRILYSEASRYLSGDEYNAFIKLSDTLFIENMKRVRDDLDWFVNKFDYRYADAPWKNAKDALPRAMQKTDSI